MEEGENAAVKAANLQPDVVILELGLPKMNGPEAAMKIRSVSPAANFIFFGNFPMSGTPGVLGADALVSKAAAMRELITAIERLAQSLIVSRSA